MGPPGRARRRSRNSSRTPSRPATRSEVVRGTGQVDVLPRQRDRLFRNSPCFVLPVQEHKAHRRRGKRGEEPLRILDPVRLLESPFAILRRPRQVTPGEPNGCPGLSNDSLCVVGRRRAFRNEHVAPRRALRPSAPAPTPRRSGSHARSEARLGRRSVPQFAQPAGRAHTREASPPPRSRAPRGCSASSPRSASPPPGRCRAPARARRGQLANSMRLFDDPIVVSA